MVPTHLRSPRSRIASAQAKVQSSNETQREITIFRNTAPYLAGNKIQEQESVSIYIMYCVLSL